MLAGKHGEHPHAGGTESQEQMADRQRGRRRRTVVADIFDEAERRDPHHRRSWVALVDGNNHQIDRIHAEASNRGIDVPIVVDLIHVLEYLWGAAWCFFPEAIPTPRRGYDTERSPSCKATPSSRRRNPPTSECRQAPQPKRAKADECAKYLVNKAKYLDYPGALAAGWPIATGIIEGACRHLVADRMNITGARWSVTGAEAVLKLRAVQANGDFETYWRFHLDREQRRVHRSRYANDVIPIAA